ncbi:MAG: hypothetical protein H0W40_05055 [Methylibium sp.]|uniref:hypothetical protein n=1 Tax=Methylibium sp. TaxID=2067992 RepID=UPI0017CBF629|nr:hypothetical protein [Methylibium sp.]MBA3596733.1 hypothetical protein [Methylibium sp.]
MLIHELLAAIVLAATGPVANTGDVAVPGPASVAWFGRGSDAPLYQRVDDGNDGDDDRDDRDDRNDRNDGDDRDD